MTFVRFIRSHEHKDPATGARTRYPAGWGGEVADDVREAADKAGALAVLAGIDVASSDAPVEPGTTFAPNRPQATGANPSDASGQPSAFTDASLKADLEAEARRRGLTVPPGATKADILALLGA